MRGTLSERGKLVEREDRVRVGVGDMEDKVSEAIEER